MIVDELVPRILIFILLEIQHQIITVHLDGTHFHIQLKEKGSFLAGPLGQWGLKVARLRLGAGGGPRPGPSGETMAVGSGAHAPLGAAPS